MSQYKLDINKAVELSDYSSIHDYMGLVGINDNFIISFKNYDIDNAEVIADMLSHNDFVVFEKEEKEDGKFYIGSYRKR